MNTHKYNIVARLLVLLVAALTLVPAEAQNSYQYAIYNYRNDGDFNAWLNIDIDSITYSCIDTLGIEHDKVVVQEVWTSDSLYRIPLEVIDSIGFWAPKPQVRDNLFYLREYHVGHLTSVDSLLLRFTSDIRRDSLPSVGQVVLSAVRVVPLENGFAGRVISIQEHDGLIDVVCESITVSDVYKRLVIVGKAYTEEEFKAQVRARKLKGLDPVDETGIKVIDDIGDLDYDVYDGMYKLVSKNPSLIWNYCIYIDELMYSIWCNLTISHPDLHMHLVFNPAKVASLDKDITDLFTLLDKKYGLADWLESYMKDGKESKKEDEEEVNLFKKLEDKLTTPPLYVGPVCFKLKLKPLFKTKGSIEVDLEMKTKARQTLSFTAKGCTVSKILNPLSWFPEALTGLDASYTQDPFTLEKLDVNAKGSVTIGVMPELEVSLIHEDIVHASVGVQAGYKMSGTINFNIADLERENTGHFWYDRFKDTKIKHELYAKVCGEIGATKSDFLTAKAEWEFFKKDLGTYYVFPEFTTPTLPQYNSCNWNSRNPLSLYSIPSRDMVGKINVGMRIDDSTGKKIKEEECIYQYQSEFDKIWNNKYLEISLKGLERGKTYKCYPQFSYWVFPMVQAGPVYEITIPEQMAVDPKEIKLQRGTTRGVSIKDGWGDFEVKVGAPDIAAATINKNRVTDDFVINGINLEGKKTGNTRVKVIDIRSGDEAEFSVIVTDEEVKALQLAKTAIKLSPGAQETIGITSGSGKYTVESNAPEVATATIEGKAVKITAQQKESIATITVKDTETGEEAIIQVKVGSGKTTSIKVEPIELDFGKVEYNTTKKETFRVTNDGTTKTTILASCQGDEVFSINDNGKEITLSPGDTKVYTVTCQSMMSNKEAVGKIKITSSDGKISQNVSLTAVGAPPTTFTLEKTTVNAMAGSVAYVNILFGSKNYSISNGNTDLVSVVIDTDNNYDYPYGRVKLLAMDEGQTVVKITDEKEKKTVSFTVTLKEDASNPFIEFSDSEVKRVCLSCWDVNGDGKLSKKEAAAVSDLNGVFMYNKKIRSFTELRYFTGLNDLNLDFYDCSRLEDIILPKNLKSIGWNTFYECDYLKNIHIPQNVSNIDGLSFQWSTNLKSITVSPANTTYDSRDNCNAIIQTETNTLNNGCYTTKIPSSVTAIGIYAFWGQSRLTQLDLPSSITYLGDCSFGGCRLKEVNIPASVTNIDGAPFGCCYEIKKIKVEPGNSVYDSREECNAIINSHTNELMQGCQNSTIPSTVTSIGMNAFKWQYFLKNISIPDNVSKIGDCAFYGCNRLEEVYISANVTSIGEGAFGDCSNLSSIVVSPSNPIYDSRNNSNTIIETATNTLVHANEYSTIPDGITSIGAYALAGYGKSSLSLPEGVTTIRYHAFRESSLRSLTLPSTLKDLGSAPFWECEDLSDVTCYAKDVPYVDKFDLGDMTFHVYDATLRVPATSVDNYRNAQYWQDFGNIVALPEGTIKVEPTKIYFGTLAKGESKTEHFTVTNKGEGILAFHLDFSGNDVFEVSDAGTSFRLTSSESKEFTVTCHLPEIAGFSSSFANIRIISDASNADEYPFVSLDVSCLQNPPSISVNPTEIDFGTMSSGESKTDHFTISNTGDGTLNFHFDYTSVFITVSGGDKESIALEAGQSRTFPVVCTIPKDCQSSGESIAIYVRSDADNEKEVVVKASVTIIPSSDTDVPAEAIDLGLPSGTRWASYNVGATMPEEGGNLYAWGEIETKDEYTSDNYLYYHQNLGSNISGTEYDVAHIKWGGNWQMPTKKQIEELINKCSHEVVEENGVKGMKFTSPNGGSIFFPFNVEGWWGTHGSYWTGTADGDNAYDLFVDEDGSVSCLGGGYRDMGRAIRPVEVTLLAPPAITITPEEEKIDFGVIIDGTDKTETLSVKNTSNSDLTIYVDADKGFERFIEVSDNMEEITLSPGSSKNYTVTAHGMSAGVSASTNVFVKIVGSDDVTKVNITSTGNDYSPLVDKTTMTLVVGEKGSVSVKPSEVNVEYDVEGIVDCIGGGPGESALWDKAHDSRVSSHVLGFTFTALQVGVVHVTFSDPYTNQSEVLTIIVTDGSTTDIPAEAIDLALPSGTKWASFNVGATKPEEAGDLYAWGETEVKESYDKSSYIHNNDNIGSDIQGTEYDVAHVKWGDGWVMPSNNEINELIRNCTSEWITLNGVNCLRFTGSNGQSIYLPDCEYWSSQHSDMVDTAYYWGAVTLGKGYVSKSQSPYVGKNVRPVKKQ